MEKQDTFFISFGLISKRVNLNRDHEKRTRGNLRVTESQSPLFCLDLSETLDPPETLISNTQRERDIKETETRISGGYDEVLKERHDFIVFFPSSYPRFIDDLDSDLLCHDLRHLSLCDAITILSAWSPSLDSYECIFDFIGCFIDFFGQLLISWFSR